MSFGGLFDDGWGSGFAADVPLGGSAMPAGAAISQPRLVSRPLTKPMFSSSSLSLALRTNKDGQREVSRATGGGGGDMDSAARNKDDENESRAESDNLGGVSGNDADQDQNPLKRKKLYRRHTPHQIRELEALFKEYPHPDEKQRLELSKRLCLDGRQVKFWFQNRRTQMKTQLERHENTILRQENERLRAENISIREVMRNPACSSCGGPVVLVDSSPAEQQAKVENARLKDELDRVCSLAEKFLGRPMSAIASSPMWSSSFELAVGSNGFAALPSATEFVAGVSSPLSTVVSPPARTVGTAGRVDGPLERSMFLELALAALDELVKMAHMNLPLWNPSMDGGDERLNYEEYRQVFSHCTGMKQAGFASEATRVTGMVMINSSALVESHVDVVRWADMFPGVIARAATTDVISRGMDGTRNGALQLMRAELQVLSPLVPVREVNFLRFCKQFADGLWAVVDVSIDGFGENQSPFTGSMKYRRLPSGCVVEDVPNGYSKVTWVEHAEYEEAAVHPLYRPMLRNGMGLGARRWVAALQRQCEFFAVLNSSCIPSDDTDVVTTASGRRSMLKLAQRMTGSFCGGVCASSAREWRRLSAGGIGEDVRVMTRQSVDDPGEPPGVVLSAATSVWLGVSPGRLFDFLRDYTLRSEWDILSNGGPIREMAHIAKGQDPGNAVSLLRASVGVSVNQGSGSGMLILQETCTDAAGWMVVYAPVDALAMHLVMGGGDPAYVALLPSGFAVLPDGPGCRGEKVGGALLTVAFQILVNSQPTAKLTMESVETVDSLISCTVQKIKVALGCEN